MVRVTNHGVEALEKSNLWKDSLEGDVLDIVLMDLEMPVMDELTCARRMSYSGNTGIVSHGIA